MKTVGVIAEFNPFHNGHSYFLQKAKETANADYCIAVMSGNFVQRGAPAIMDKYLRTQAALANGADIVLELPVYYATSSAELFAFGGISILNNLGVVDCLAFGSETTDITLLSKAAAILHEEPQLYRDTLKNALAAGMSYPAAQSHALITYLRENDFVKMDSKRVDDSWSDIFSNPNALLGITYLKSLKQLHSSIQPIAVKRLGDYHSEHITQDSEDYPSATALRGYIFTKIKDISLSAFSRYTGQIDFILDLRKWMPDSAVNIIMDEFGITWPVSEDDLSAILQYRLLSLPVQNTQLSQYMNFTQNLHINQRNPLSNYLDIGDELANRFVNKRFSFESFTQFASLCNTKESTLSRINRALLHIVLNIKTDDLHAAGAFTAAPYVRLLGCRREAVPLLSKIKKYSHIPLITKPANAPSMLSEDAWPLWNLDITSAHIYESLSSQRYAHSIRHEYQRTICGLT